MQIENKTEKSKYITHTPDYVANHFGFDFIEMEQKIFKNDMIIEDEKVKVLKKFKKELNNKRGAPLKMFFYKKPVITNKKIGANMGIDIINVETAIAEATVIKTATSILKEEGYSDIIISLNALGDKDSVKLFEKALTEFYRKNKTSLKAAEQSKISKDPLFIYHSPKEHLQELNQEAPTPLQFLSEKNISHFKEVIEYLENFDINYKINESLTGSKLFFSKIIFKIHAKNPKTKKVEEVATGGRYDEMAAAAVNKRKLSAIGLNMSFDKKETKKIKLKEKKIEIHLLKIGSTAKLKYLDVLDTMLKMRVPIKYDIEEEKISKQIKKAIDEKAEYAIILGEVESKKNKVLVRKMDNYSQKEISIKNLPKYIKKFVS